MTHNDFVVEARGIIALNYRILLSTGLLLAKPNDLNQTVEYLNLPNTPSTNGLLNNESLDQALNSIAHFANEKLSDYLLLALIGVFEQRLAAWLNARNLSPVGTLGAIQNRVQTAKMINLQCKHDLDEVRERRNVLVHHQGFANEKYVLAMSNVVARAAPFISAATPGSALRTNPFYLSYAVSVLSNYSSDL